MAPVPLFRVVVVPPFRLASAGAPTHDAFSRPSLYVGDLHPETTEADLAEAFLSVGPIVSAKLCRDRLTRQSLCYAYVNFFSFQDASWAMALLNHSELRGKPMRIMWCQRDPQTRKTGIGNLYVKNLHPSISSAALEKIFSKYGTILSCKAVEEGGISKGFGFVQFKSEDSGLAALKALHGTLLAGKKLYVSKFLKKSERKGSDGQEMFTNLYVKNLDENLTEDLLRKIFSEHGEVCSSVIMKGDDGRSRKFGFVRFATHEEAKKAIEALNGAQIGSKTLFVGRAQKKAERVEFLKSAHSNSFDHQGQKSAELCVSNLDATIGDRELKQIFGEYGKVTSAKVICDENGVSRGFGFVSITFLEEAKKALVLANGANFQGLPFTVVCTQQREEQTRQLHYVQYLPEFYTPNWDVFTPNCNFLTCPALHALYLSSQTQLMHPNFDRPVYAWSPFGLYTYWENHFPSVFGFENGTVIGAGDAFSGRSSYRPFVAASGRRLQSFEESIQPVLKEKITRMLLELQNSNVQDDLFSSTSEPGS